MSCFNDDFVASGSLFDPTGFSPELYSSSASEETAITPSFSFSPFTTLEVLNALKVLDSTKAAGPDNLEPHFLKIAADFIALALTHIFNLSLSTNTIPHVWKSAYVVPLLKEGDPSNLNNYRPISK